MRTRLQPWQLALLVIALCAAALLFTRWRTGRELTARNLVQYLPPDRSVHVYIDIAALRGGGLIDLPVAGGPIAVAGLTLDEIQTRISADHR